MDSAAATTTAAPGDGGEDVSSNSVTGDPPPMVDTGLGLTVAEKLHGFPLSYVITTNSRADRVQTMVWRLQESGLRAVMADGILSY